MSELGRFADLGERRDDTAASGSEELRKAVDRSESIAPLSHQGRVRAIR